MTNTIPPDTVAPGQTGHIDAHNNIADVLTAHQNQLTATPAIRAGTATLAAGTVNVSRSDVTSGTIVLVTRLVPGGTLGHLSVPTISNGTGFTITSSSATETSSVAWTAVG